MANCLTRDGLRGALAVAMMGDGASASAKSAVFDAALPLDGVAADDASDRAILGVDPLENQHGIG